MRGLIIGRFQPFHKGHLHLVRQILSECEEIVIAIASAQYNYIEKDPFTAGERIEMIHDSLREAKVDLSTCYIVPIINDENNARWVAHLQSFLPVFDVVYTGNPYVKMLMRNSRIKVRKISFHDRNAYNATRIRNLMVEGKEWEELVPKAVASLIERLDGGKRMKIISRSDSRPQEW